MNSVHLPAKQGVIVADGAMGTYFSMLTGLPASQCELANQTHPEIISRIHREYLHSGARLLRTNTFSANTAALGLPQSDVLELIRLGYRLAETASDGQAIVAADIGTIYLEGDEQADPYPEYCAIVDTFLDCGAQTFLFETLAELQQLSPVLTYLHNKRKDAAILLSFSLSPDGRTRAGIPLSQLLRQLETLPVPISAVGLNCGCGPMHLYQHALALCAWAKENGDLPAMVLPNAGYPAVEQQRTVFNTSPDYFAVKTAEIAAAGARVVGGCCGTTPEHILRLSQKLQELTEPAGTKASAPAHSVSTHAKAPITSGFSQKIQQGKFLLAAELDPPYGSDLSKLRSASLRLKEAGVDVITISDSPLARVKLDSVVCAAKLQRECGISALPHLCCRDKNVNALRASLLGAHCEGIRTVLAVTGDHVPESDRGYVKPVFNLSSIKLMETIHQMNSDIFADSPILVGGALNPRVSNMEGELKRAQRKMEAGASFFLTQPVFEEDFAMVDRVREWGAKVLIGIMPLVSYRNAYYMSNEVPGIHIPEESVQRFSPDMSREQAAEAGIQLAVEIARKALPHADGFYFMTPFNRSEIICGILERLKYDLPPVNQSFAKPKMQGKGFAK